MNLIPATPQQSWKSIIGTALAFCAGLMVVLLATNYLLGKYYARHHQPHDLIGSDVYETAIVRVHRPGTEVVNLYLGDSVSRQFYYAGHEPDPRFYRYLTANQAIGVAGQYFLLQDALANYRNTRHVYLIYTPRSWANNLDGPLAIDYFCGFFHRPNQILDILKTKHDIGLTTQQVGRFFLPNLITANRESNLRLQSRESEAFKTPDGANKTRDASENSTSSEPIIRIAQAMVDNIWPPLPAYVVPSGDQSPGPTEIPMTKLSANYLGRIRRLCADQHIALTVVPAPCISNRPWLESNTPYDFPIWYLPPEQFVDSIHLNPEYVEPRRKEFIARYRLPNE